MMPTVVQEHETARYGSSGRPLRRRARQFRDIGHVVREPMGWTGMVFHPKSRKNHKYYIVNLTTEGKGFQSRILQGTTKDDLTIDSGEPLRK